MACKTESTGSTRSQHTRVSSSQLIGPRYQKHGYNFRKTGCVLFQTATFEPELMQSLLGTVARRISIHRATTVGPKSPLCQVVLKNTSASKETSSSHLRMGINRSQSLLTTNARIPVLAPSRSERSRLEGLLVDVWSRDILPFPGFTTRAKSEHLVRHSASSMMRKLSVASITSSFGRRPGGDSHGRTMPEYPMSAESTRVAGSTTNPTSEPGTSLDEVVLNKENMAPGPLPQETQLWAKTSTQTLPLQDLRDGSISKGHASSEETKSDTTDEGTAATTIASDTSGKPHCANSQKYLSSNHSPSGKSISTGPDNQSTLHRTKSFGAWIKDNARGDTKGPGIRSLFRGNGISEVSGRRA